MNNNSSSNNNMFPLPARRPSLPGAIDPPPVLPPVHDRKNNSNKFGPFVTAQWDAQRGFGICCQCPYVRLSITIRNSVENKKSCARPISQRWPRDARYISRSYETLWRYGHSKLSKILDLYFVWIENSAISFAVHENPTLEPNMKWIGSSLQRYGHSRMLGHGTPFWRS